MTAQTKLRAVKTLVRVTLNDSSRIRPRTEVSSLLIVQPAAKIQSPEPRVDHDGGDRLSAGADEAAGATSFETEE